MWKTFESRQTFAVKLCLLSNYFLFQECIEKFTNNSSCLLVLDLTSRQHAKLHPSPSVWVSMCSPSGVFCPAGHRDSQGQGEVCDSSWMWYNYTGDSRGREYCSQHHRELWPLMNISLILSPPHRSEKQVYYMAQSAETHGLSHWFVCGRFICCCCMHVHLRLVNVYVSRLQRKNIFDNPHSPLSRPPPPPSHPFFLDQGSACVLYAWFRQGGLLIPGHQGLAGSRVQKPGNEGAWPGKGSCLCSGAGLQIA